MTLNPESEGDEYLNLDTQTVSTTTWSTTTVQRKSGINRSRNKKPKIEYTSAVGYSFINRRNVRFGSVRNPWWFCLFKNSSSSASGLSVPFISIFYLCLMFCQMLIEIWSVDRYAPFTFKSGPLFSVVIQFGFNNNLIISQPPTEHWISNVLFLDPDCRLLHPLMLLN